VPPNGDCGQIKDRVVVCDRESRAKTQLASQDALVRVKLSSPLEELPNVLEAGWIGRVKILGDGPRKLLAVMDY
jgi:hypothetical protein